MNDLTRWLARRIVLPCAGVAAVILLGAYVYYLNSHLIDVRHAPSLVDRRSGDLSFNITGRISRIAPYARYRLNGEEWRSLPRIGPRSAKPNFTLELLGQDLRPGANEVVIQAGGPLRSWDEWRTSFRYDPAPIRLPVTVDWKDVDLDVQEGSWETFETEAGWRVRPVPGTEGYDRLLNVVGAIAGGRRIRTELTYRYRVGETEFGYGILSMWGGHPEATNYRPRRGWSFALSWYWDRYDGVGNEISYKQGDGTPLWVNSYNSLSPEPDVTYSLEIESYPEIDGNGDHLRYRNRLKWWPKGEEPPQDWIELTDTEGATLPEGEYAVTLLAYNSQVEYGPVTIEAMETAVVER